MTSACLTKMKCATLTFDRLSRVRAQNNVKLAQIHYQHEHQQDQTIKRLPTLYFMLFMTKHLLGKNFGDRAGEEAVSENY